MSEYYLTRPNDDKKFGVPEQKKFPLPDADHVRSAIKFFNYVEPRYEKQLARAILRRAKEYNLDLSEMNIGDNNRFKKYLPNELKHHGILGQKWGKRNGPPYPLDPEDHSKAEKEAAKKKFSLSDEQKKKLKKAAIIGAAVVGTALVTYGAYKLYSNRGMIRNYTNLGKKNVDFIRNSGKFDYLDIPADNVEKGNYVKGIIDPNAKPEEFAEKLKIFNPNGTHNECGPSAIAAAFGVKNDNEYLEVKPRESGISTYELIEDLFGSTKAENVYKQLDKTKDSFAKARTSSGMSEILSKRYPGGSSGIISFSSIPNAFSNGTAGHAFTWSISDDDAKKVSFFDGSNGKIDASTYFDLVGDDTIIDWARLDNLEILPDKVSKYFNVKKA